MVVLCIVYLSHFWNNNRGTQCKLLMVSLSRLEAAQNSPMRAWLASAPVTGRPSSCNISRKCHRVETNHLECFLRQLVLIMRLFPLSKYCSAGDLLPAKQCGLNSNVRSKEKEKRRNSPIKVPLHFHTMRSQRPLM